MNVDFDFETIKLSRTNLNVLDPAILDVEGEAVYVLHFERPIGTMQSDELREQFGHGPRKSSDYTPRNQHYIGYAPDIRSRLKEHASGSSKVHFVDAAHSQGIDFVVTAVYPGGVALEKKMKRQRNHRKFCPICKEEFLKRKRDRNLEK